MKNYFRTDGKKEGASAFLHEYRDGTVKIEVEMEAALAKKLMEAAVSSGGRASMQIGFGGETVPAQAVGGRIDSRDSSGARVGGTGVVSFSSLKSST